MPHSSSCKLIKFIQWFIPNSFVFPYPTPATSYNCSRLSSMFHRHTASLRCCMFTPHPPSFSFHLAWEDMHIVTSRHNSSLNISLSVHIQPCLFFLHYITSVGEHIYDSWKNIFPHYTKYDCINLSVIFYADCIPGYLLHDLYDGYYVSQLMMYLIGHLHSYSLLTKVTRTKKVIKNFFELLPNLIKIRLKY